mmetsp:Transcript_41324/g.96020  ORF Transcript_41324/g.96020 Transcript_41324/m.96020 type:complete len:247 (+) Transcript_41324:2436-3176(+)
MAVEVGFVAQDQLRHLALAHLRQVDPANGLKVRIRGNSFQQQGAYLQRQEVPTHVQLSHGAVAAEGLEKLAQTRDILLVGVVVACARVPPRGRGHRLFGPVALAKDVLYQLQLFKRRPSPTEEVGQRPTSLWADVISIQLQRPQGRHMQSPHGGDPLGGEATSQKKVLEAAAPSEHGQHGEDVRVVRATLERHRGGYITLTPAGRPSPARRRNATLSAAAGYLLIGGLLLLGLGLFLRVWAVLPEP